MGLDFVGVGGYKSYLTFLRFAEALKIPWVIFSDAETDNIKVSVQKQFSECNSGKSESDCIIFLDDGYDFEYQLIKDGFNDEIKKAIASFDVYTNEQHRAAAEPGRLAEIAKYDDKEIHKIITGDKTKYAPAIAKQIIESGKDLPPKVIELFGKIADVFKMQEAEHDGQG